MVVASPTRSLVGSRSRITGENVIENTGANSGITFGKAGATQTINGIGTTAEAVVGSAPVTSGLACTVEKMGGVAKLSFTFTALSIAVTDAGGSGSYGATKIFDFVQQALSFLGCRQNYTAFVEGAALTGAVGDAVFEIGIGTTAISAAADGVLATANDNVGGDVNITNSGGTGAGTEITGAVVAGIDGTATASDLYLNWSGTAATIDANSTLAVTGTATVVVALLGDD